MCIILKRRKNLSLSFGLIFFQCFFTLSRSITAADWRIWGLGSDFTFKFSEIHTYEVKQEPIDTLQ